MDVLEDVERRGFPAQRGGVHQGAQPPPTRIRIDPRKCHPRIGDPHQVIKQQQVLRLGVRSRSPYPRAGGLRVKTLHTSGRAQQPHHGTEGDLAGVRLAESRKHLHAALTRHHRHLAHQPALANAGCALHADHRAVPIDRALQQAFHGGQFPLPTDQSRLSTPASAMPFAHRGGRDNGGSSRDDGGRGWRRPRQAAPAPVSPADLGQQ
jgi:hypothetical protein